MPSFSNLTQLIKNSCKTYSNSRSDTNTTNDIFSRSIYNPKHYIDGYRKQERRPFESFHIGTILAYIFDCQGSQTVIAHRGRNYGEIYNAHCPGFEFYGGQTYGRLSGTFQPNCE